MLNWIWLGMMLVAVIVGGFSGKLAPMTEEGFKMAKIAVMDIALPLVGLMALWMGMMRLAERAGIVQILARALRPVMRRLFPDVPVEHPAMGAMVLNMSANMLGLGNAATPLGLRAMGLLQKLNPHNGVASNSMVTFLVINTASIQLVPTTAISILAVQGAKNASGIVVPAFLSTCVAMTCGIVAAKLLSRLPIFQIRQEDVIESQATETKEETPEPEVVQAPPLTKIGRVWLWLFFGAFGAMFFTLVWPHTANGILSSVRGLLPESARGVWQYGDFWPGLGDGQRILRAVSLLAVPFLLAFFPLYAALRKVKVYEQFCEGAKEAFTTAVKIVPFLVAMLVAITLLREAGVVDVITGLVGPALVKIGFPPELLPLSVLRPLSGSASLGTFTELVKTFGADSMIARTAATIYGSTETTFYVLAVYFGSVGIRKMRHAVLAGLTADIVAIVAAVVFCKWMFG